MNEIMVISNTRCRLDKDGNVELHLEDTARGLGFTDNKNGVEYVRWARVKEYLEEFGFATRGESEFSADDKGAFPPGGDESVAPRGKDELPDFIPLNIVFKLGFKAKNDVAIGYQNRVTDEILPTIFKTGRYEVPGAGTQALGPLELLELQVKALRDIEQKQQAQQTAIETVNHRLDTIGEIISLNPQAWREESKAMIVRIAQAWGGNSFIPDVQSAIYKLMLDRFGIDLKRRQQNKRAKAAMEGMNKTQQGKISKVDVIAESKQATEAYLALIKEMAIKYGVDKEVAGA